MFKAPVKKSNTRYATLPKLVDMWIEITRVGPAPSQVGKSALLAEFKIHEIYSQEIVPSDKDNPKWPQTLATPGETRSLYFAIDPIDDKFGFNAKSWFAMLLGCGIPEAEHMAAQELCYGPENFLMGKQLRVQRTAGQSPKGAKFLDLKFSDIRPTKAA